MVGPRVTSPGYSSVCGRTVSLGVSGWMSVSESECDHAVLSGRLGVMCVCESECERL